MTVATRADVLAKLQTMVADLMVTTSTGSQMVAKYGHDWTKWPANSKWGLAQQLYTAAVAEINQLQDAAAPPPPPPPPPVNTPVDVAVAFAASLGFKTLNTTVSDDFIGFSGASVDTKKWGAKTSGMGSAHNVGYANISLDGSSSVKIKAIRNADGTYNSGWLSGAVGYSGTRYVEAYAKLPGGAGTWPAPAWEWAYPWGAGGLENDVNEALGKDAVGNYHFTVHNWDAGNTQKGITIPTGVDLTAGFHRYGTAVYKDHIDCYFDGKKVATINASDVGMTDFTAYQEVMNIDLAMGGWGGTIDPSILEADLLVDYVLVFQP